MSRTVFNRPHFTLSSLPDGENGFSNDAFSPPDVKFTPQNLQMLFFFCLCLSLVFVLFNKPLWEFLTIHGLKIFSQCPPPVAENRVPYSDWSLN